MITDIAREVRTAFERLPWWAQAGVVLNLFVALLLFLVLS